jgi:uncharacterized protein involved in exopolysaccharide biosynthesis
VLQSFQSPQPSLPTRVDIERDVVQLRSHLVSLYRHRLAIGVTTVVCAALAAVWTILVPIRYEATATLAVTPPTVDDPGRTIAQVAARIVPIMGSQVVAEQIVNEFQLGRPPRNMAPGDFLEQVLTVRHVPETNLIKVVTRLDDAQLTEKIANRTAVVGIQQVGNVGQSAVGAVEASLKAVLDEAAKRKQEAEGRYDAFRQTAQLEAAKKDVETLLAQRAEFQKLMVTLETEKARLARRESELADRRPVNTLTQSIDSNPTLSEAARQTPGTARELLGLQTKNEFVNQVYQGLDLALAEGRANVAALESTRARLSGIDKVNEQNLAVLDRLYRVESELDSLDLDRQVARKAYTDANTQYQGARLSAIARIPQIVVADPAVVPERPLGRWLLRNSLLGAIIGAFGAACYVLARQALLLPRAT